MKTVESRQNQPRSAGIAVAPGRKPWGKSGKSPEPQSGDTSRDDGPRCPKNLANF